jgi:hypothetical protein
VNLDLGHVLMLAALLVASVYLLQALRVRELALAAARRACRQAGVQLLDETVSIRRLSMSRDSEGRWRIWRHYRFEYSVDGFEREAGSVLMLGMRVHALVMAERGQPA